MRKCRTCVFPLNKRALNEQSKSTRFVPCTIRRTRKWEELNFEKEMHSYGYRANGVLSLSLTILALLCTVASLSGGILNLPPPSAQVEVSLSLSLSLSIYILTDVFRSGTYVLISVGGKHQLVSEAPKWKRRGKFILDFEKKIFGCQVSMIIDSPLYDLKINFEFLLKDLKLRFLES